MSDVSHDARIGGAYVAGVLTARDGYSVDANPHGRNSGEWSAFISGFQDETMRKEGKVKDDGSQVVAQRAAPATYQQVEAIEALILSLVNLTTFVVKKISAIQQQETAEMATLADIQTAVANETTVEQSAITLLQQLSQQLQAALASNDPNAIQSVVDQLNANAQALADAVSANTPAQPTPPAPSP